MKKLIAITTILLLLINVTRAQEELKEDTIKQYRLDEIIIKSPKFNRNIFEIPAAASMLPERLIETSRVENLTDVSGIVPNFFMPDYGSKLTSPVYIRGVGNRINTPSVGLYVDNVPYFEKAAFNFEFFDIERIEVLRGPQGTLYGRNTMGGLINVITNRPTDERLTKVSVDYGSYNQIRTNISHNQPIGKDFAVLANFSQFHNDGYFTNMFNNEKVDRLNSYSGRLNMQYDPGERFRAALNLQYEDSKQGGYPYAPYNNEENEAQEINYNLESIYNRQMFTSGLNLQYDMPSYTIRAVTSFQSLDDLQGIDQDFSPASMYYVTQDQTLNMISQEVNFQSDENKHYDWLLGAFAFTQMLDKSVSLEYGADFLNQRMPGVSDYYYTKTYNNSSSGIAFFHQSTFKLGDISMTAGIRADYEKATLDFLYDDYKDGTKTNKGDLQGNLSFFEIIPKLALKYNVSDYLVPYATFAKGYNSGGFNTSFDNDEEMKFEPEHTYNYEAGVKTKWLKQRIYANLAFFYIDWINQQVSQPIASGRGSHTTNAGKSESKGVELEIKALPVKNLETWLSIGYNDAKFIEYVQDEDEDYSGNYIPFVPRFSFNTGGNYTISVNRHWLERIRLNLTYSGFGKHYWNEDNIAYQDYYGLLNHRIGFEKGNVTFAFWGKNILNADYNSYYFYALGNWFAQIGKPAQIGVNLRVKF